jgi:hypothetical protein
VNAAFFETTRHYSEGKIETVLTLRTQDVVAPEIVKDGVVTDSVPAGAERSN